MKQDQSVDAAWAIGTGWLIKNDLIATAGHNAYDWRYGLGPAVRVKAYIGYFGQQNVKDPAVQFSTVSRITTTIGWLTSRDNKANDLAFMQLDAPFSNVTPYRFADTPGSGNEMLGIVGYPGDKVSPLTGELGAQMWEEFKQINFNLDTAPLNMLNYDISTFGGQYMR